MRELLLFVLVSPAMFAQPVGGRAFRLDEIRTPPGFEVSVYATVAGGPRHLAFGPDGVLYAAARNAGAIVAIPEPGRTLVAAGGLNGPHTLVFRGGALYVSVNDGVLRFDNAVTDDRIIRGQPRRILSLPAGGQHVTRTVGFSPDGDIFVAAGSTCNFCNEADRRRAALMRFREDGSGETVFATGLRNSVSFAWHPTTGELWATDHGGDNLGDDTPPEEINIVREGMHYGWPDCYSNNRPVPSAVFPQVRASRCESAEPPEFEMQGHSAPLGIAFYTGDQFPASWRNDALVAFHGSWNRTEPAGFKVVRVRASTGHASGIEDLLWGFLDSPTRTRSGRPVHAIPGPDGAVYVSDDASGNIYRIRYAGPRINDNGIAKSADGVYTMQGARLASESSLVRIFGNGITLDVVEASDSEVKFILPDSLRGNITIRLENDLAFDEQQITVE